MFPTHSVLTAATLLLAGYASPALFSQSSPDLLERLRLTAASASLDSKGALPFHLKATIQLEPQFNHPAEQGKVELWSSPDAERIVYDFPSYHATSVQTPAGQYRTKDAGSPPYVVRYLLAQLQHPAPLSFDPALVTATLNKQIFGKAELDCITLAAIQSKPSELHPAPPVSYCLEPSTSDLRIAVDGTGLTTTRQTLGAFRNHRLSTQLSVVFKGRATASLHVDLLQGLSELPPELTEVSALGPSPSQPAYLPPAGTLGSIRPKETRLYAPLASQDRITGSVLLHATIGVDGRIKDLQLISSSNDGLSQAAFNSVKDWTYYPYLQNGKPTEVDTTITYNFINGGTLH